MWLLVILTVQSVHNFYTFILSCSINLVANTLLCIYNINIYIFLISPSGWMQIVFRCFVLATRAMTIKLSFILFFKSIHYQCVPSQPPNYNQVSILAKLICNNRKSYRPGLKIISWAHIIEIYCFIHHNNYSTSILAKPPQGHS